MLPPIPGDISKTTEVGINHPLPLLIRHIQQRAGLGDTRVIDDDRRHTTELLLNRVESAGNTDAVCHIHGHSDGLAALGPYFIPGQLDQLQPPRRKHHTGARLGQYRCEMSTKTAGCASDQGDPAANLKRLQQFVGVRH